MYCKREILRSKQDQTSKNELELVENELAEKYSEKMFTKIMEGIKECDNSEEGGFNTGHIWKFKKKFHQE